MYLVLVFKTVILWKEGFLAARDSFLHRHWSGDAGYLLAAVPWAAAADTRLRRTTPACFETHLEVVVKFYRAMLVDYFFCFNC